MRKGERTKQKIVKQAIKMIARKGFSETSFQQIADSCKLSQSAVIHQFKNKSGLIQAVLDEIVKNNHELVSSSIDIRDGAYERLTKHCLGNVKWAINYPDEAQIFVLLFYLACFDKTFEKLHEQLTSQGRERVTELLLAGKREGVFHFGKSVEVLTEALYDSLIGCMLNNAARSNQQVSLESSKRRLILVIRALTGIDAKQ